VVNGSITDCAARLRDIKGLKSDLVTKTEAKKKSIVYLSPVCTTLLSCAVREISPKLMLNKITLLSNLYEVLCIFFLFSIKGKQKGLKV